VPDPVPDFEGAGPGLQVERVTLGKHGILPWPGLAAGPIEGLWQSGATANSLISFGLVASGLSRGSPVLNNVILYETGPRRLRKGLLRPIA
jgi:hypothetical protein